MGYMHIENLYKNQTVLLFKECYALEKIHGTSAHLSFQRHSGKEGVADSVTVGYFSGGEKYEAFKALFDEEALAKVALEMGHRKLMVYGEAYGGKCQGMKDTYGPNLKFIVFDVLVQHIDGSPEIWLDVERANIVASKLGLEFVAWNKVSTDLDVLNLVRDLPSRQAVRNGITEPRIAEGIVIRPPIEVTLSNGARVMAKHKRPEFSERASKKDTAVDPQKAVVLEKASAIAEEWVVPHRLEHVLDKVSAALGRKPGIEDMRTVIDAMIEDVTREAKGEIVESKEAVKAIGTAAAKLFRRHVMGQL